MALTCNIISSSLSRSLALGRLRFSEMLWALELGLALQGVGRSPEWAATRAKVGYNAGLSGLRRGERGTEYGEDEGQRGRAAFRALQRRLQARGVPAGCNCAYLEEGEIASCAGGAPERVGLLEGE